MTIDDPIELHLQQIKQNLDANITRDLREATVAGVLSLIPGVGSAIQSLLDGQAKANLEQRWLQLFIDFRARIEEVRESIPDESYYGSEQFQTLLALAFQQLATTHDRAKLRLLADALANSGTTPFQDKDKDKELYLRLIRDLSVRDISALRDDRLRNSISSSSPITYTADEIAQFSRLVSMGLLVEQHISGFGGGPPAIGNDRHYQIAELGNSLLMFISDSSFT
jgi:hypothetical protein